MDLHQLCACLGACVGADAAARQAAEELLNQHKHSRGQIVNLLRVAMEESLDPSVRQVAAISFKNAVKRDWDSPLDGKPSPIAEEDKAPARALVLDALVRAPPPVRAQLGECVRAMVYADYPERWPGLGEQVYAHLVSQDQSRVRAALCVLRLLARKYEFADEEERAPLEALTDATFPLLLPITRALLALPDPSIEVAELLKLVCKVLWSSMYLAVPRVLLRDDQFAGWMGALHALILLRVPLEHMPSDPDARKAWQWWKLKKWVLHIAYRLFSRYGDPKLCRAQGDVAFATRFMAECSATFLQAVLQVLSTLAQGAYLSPRVVNLLLQYAGQAVSYSHTWKLLKPHAQQILHSVVFPLLCFTDDDEELWRDDPHEYIRKGYDIIEDIYSPRVAAMNLMHDLCESRGKSQLAPTMAALVGVLNAAAAARAAGGELDAAGARRLDGALLAIGSLADLLKAKKSAYRGQLEPMLLAHVAPLFASSHGHLRAKAAWLAGTYADAEFPASPSGGPGPSFTALLQAVMAAIGDRDLPVRVDAAVAVRSFLDAVEDDEHLAALRPLVPELLSQYLRLSQEIDNEDLLFSLETLVERFADHMAPYAVGLTTHLAAQFWRIAADEDDAAAAAGSGSDADADDAEGALAAYGVLRTIATVLESVSG